MAEYSLDSVFTQTDGRIYMTGVQALVRSLLEQRSIDDARGWETAGFVSGYRGSPLGGVDTALLRASKYIGAAGITFQPGLNEDLAATAIWGTQQAGLFEKAVVDGVVGVWYGKGPGVDRSGDVFKHANLAGTSPRGGVVVLAGDDHVCKSSTTAHQSEPALIASGIPVLNPASVEEIVPFFLHSVAMSRYSGCWISLKCLTDTIDSSASVQAGWSRTEFKTPDMELPAGGLNIRRADTPLAQEERLVDWKLPAAKAFATANGIDRATLSPRRMRYGIVTTGKSWLDVMTALKLMNLDEEQCLALGIGVYKVGMSWPLATDGLLEFAGGCEEILIVEEKRPLIEEQAVVALYGVPASRRPLIVGKRDADGARLLSSHGELDPVQIARALQRRLLAWSIVADAPSLPDTHRLEAFPERRSAWFCSGCPHNTSTRVPEGSLAGAGIGCHGLAALNDPQYTIPFTHMGGEGANWIGRSRYVESGHVFQNLGDGTFNHSGLLAIRAAVAAEVNITYKILFNDVVAMTGGQRHEGSLSPERIAWQVAAEGVARVVIVAENPAAHAQASLPAGSSIRHRDELDAVQREMRDTPGVTVIVYDQACATERRRRRKRGIEPKPDIAVHINSKVCEGCGDCGAVSNCVAIQPLPTPVGIKRRIDQTQCNVDQSCIKGFCPSFVTVKGTLAKAAKGRQGAPRPPEVAPPATDVAAGSSYGMLITGIGGTGIVTISALLGMAAHLDGKRCRVLDQTGMAQKNGGVVSHLIIADAGDYPLPVRIPAEGVNLLLGCDLLGAATPDALVLTKTDVTKAVVNDDVTYTGRFTRVADLDLQIGGNRNRLVARLGRNRPAWFPASRLATELFGDATTGNMLLLGCAWQKGLVPLSLDSLMRAIELNGVAVAMNKDAFAWGRAAAEGILPVTAAEAGKNTIRDRGLDEIVADLRRRVVDFQDERYAGTFDRLVEQARRAERTRLGQEGALTQAVAESMHKLMCYKDEYEVARLLTDKEQMDLILGQYAPGARFSYHLAPPLLARIDPRTGHPRKMSFGPWLRPVLKVLAKAKGLRGTAFDPFGWTRERRHERALISDFSDTMTEALQMLTRDNVEAVLSLARAPMKIRGYGHVKEKARLAFEADRTRLVAQLEAGKVPERELA